MSSFVNRFPADNRENRSSILGRGYGSSFAAWLTVSL